MALFRIASCKQCHLYGICNFACTGAGEKFSVLLYEPVVIGHKDIDVSGLLEIVGLTGRLFAVLCKSKQFMGNVLENPYKRIGFVDPAAVFRKWNGLYHRT